MKAQLHSSTQEQQKCSPVKVLLDDAVDVYIKLEAAIMEQCSNTTEHALIKPFQVNNLQRERKLRAECVYVAKQIQFYVSCGHKSTNLS